MSKGTTITLYEVAWLVDVGDDARELSQFVAARGPAVEITKQRPDNLPEGGKVRRVQVYRCTMQDLPPRAMMFAILNGQRPTREALVFGDLPLPMAERSRPTHQAPLL